MKRGRFIGLLTVALLLLDGRDRLRAETPIGPIVVAQGTPQGPYQEPAMMNGKSPEEKMSMRFPQPIKVGDLIGLAVLDDYDLTIGYVRQVVRTPEGKIRLIVTQGGWLGPWFSFGSRLVAVPIEVVVILGRQLVAFDMPRQEFASAPTWSGDRSPIAPDETIKIAIARR
jgi:PRC-barrel domain